MSAARQASTPVTDRLRRAAAALKLHRLLPGVAAGVVAGVINVIVAISLAALIFAGDLSGFVSQGIGLILLGGIVALIVTGLLSSFSGTLTATQDTPGAILAVLAARGEDVAAIRQQYAQGKAPSGAAQPTEAAPQKAEAAPAAEQIREQSAPAPQEAEVVPATRGAQPPAPLCPESGDGPRSRRSAAPALCIPRIPSRHPGWSRCLRRRGAQTSCMRLLPRPAVPPFHAPGMTPAGRRTAFPG